MWRGRRNFPWAVFDAKTQNYWRKITSLIAGVPVNIGRWPNRIRSSTDIFWQNSTMSRDDLLFWLSLVWFFALVAAASWVAFGP
jgi:hypothetical protein